MVMALPFISINFSALKSESVLIKDSVAIPAVCARVSLGKFIVVTGKYSQGSNTIKHKPGRKDRGPNKNAQGNTYGA